MDVSRSDQESIGKGECKDLSEAASADMMSHYLVVFASYEVHTLEATAIELRSHPEPEPVSCKPRLKGCTLSPLRGAPGHRFLPKLRI